MHLYKYFHREEKAYRRDLCCPSCSHRFAMVMIAHGEFSSTTTSRRGYEEAAHIGVGEARKLAEEEARLWQADKTLYRRCPRCGFSETRRKHRTLFGPGRDIDPNSEETRSRYVLGTREERDRLKAILARLIVCEPNHFLGWLAAAGVTDDRLSVGPRDDDWCVFRPWEVVLLMPTLIRILQARLPLKLPDDWQRQAFFDNLVQIFGELARSLGVFFATPSRATGIAGVHGWWPDFDGWLTWWKEQGKKHWYGLLCESFRLFGPHAKAVTAGLRSWPDTPDLDKLESYLAQIARPDNVPSGDAPS